MTHWTEFRLCYSILFLAVAITSCVLLYFYVKDKERP